MISKTKHEPDISFGLTHQFVQGGFFRGCPSKLSLKIMPEGKKPPRPGPARLTKNADVDEWLKCAFNNQYLPEATMKKLCEICKELLMEGKQFAVFPVDIID